MKSLIFIFVNIVLVGPAFGSQGFADSHDPRIVNKSGKHEVVLPKAAKVALKKWCGECQILPYDFYDETVAEEYVGEGRLPMAATGDFNGDGFKDAAIIVDNGKSKQTALVLLTKRKSWEIKELDSWSYEKPNKIETEVGGKKHIGFPHFVRAIPEGVNDHSKIAKINPRDGIQVETHMGKTDFYFIDEGKKVRTLEELLKGN